MSRWLVILRDRDEVETQWRVEAEERERAIEEALRAYPRAFGRSPGWDGVEVVETRPEPDPSA
jgi:hypothetical protein